MHTTWLHDLAQTSLGDFAASDELDARLSGLAVRAQSDQAAALELLECLAWKIQRFVHRFRFWDLDPFDLDDVAQEAYLIYLDTLRRWNPKWGSDRPAGYLYYFLKVFPLWLGNRVRSWRRPARPPVIHHIQPAAALDDVTVIDDFCSNLSREESTLVQLRVLRGFSIPLAARAMGIARRTAYRRWRRILALGRQYLREAG